MEYRAFRVPEAVEAELAHISATMPGTVFYSANGDALFLASDNDSVISVSVHADGKTVVTDSAYIIAVPPDTIIAREILADVEGWARGWEC